MPIAKNAILAEAGRFLVNEMKRNAHVVSGDMRDSIKADPPSSEGVAVSVNVPYAAIENARAGIKLQTLDSRPPYGPHNFADRAVQAFQTDYQSKIKAAYDMLFRAS